MVFKSEKCVYREARALDAAVVMRPVDDRRHPVIDGAVVVLVPDPPREMLPRAAGLELPSLNHSCDANVSLMEDVFEFDR